MREALAPIASPNEYAERFAHIRTSIHMLRACRPAWGTLGSLMLLAHSASASASASCAAPRAPSLLAEWQLQCSAPSRHWGQDGGLSGLEFLRVEKPFLPLIAGFSRSTWTGRVGGEQLLGSTQPRVREGSPAGAPVVDFHFIPMNVFVLRQHLHTVTHPRRRLLQFAWL